ncbi:MAG: hypothetical protein Q8L55_04050 [Phycisphaerales bacterium]|nr:hypothetical protein [Phycisphaerales bacterium]
MQPSSRPALSRRGLSRVEVIVIVIVVSAVVCVGVCAGAAGLMLPALGKARASARQIKCATQVRNTIQAMTIFAQGNKDSYPLPSIIDINNQTIANGGRGKDTTNNILSILVYNSSISPELLYTPSESNSSIRACSEYQNSSPKAAAVPANALWDPALRCDFTTGTGHTSYANAMPSGDTASDDPKERGRLNMWGNTFNAMEAVFGNRGPTVTGTGPSAMIDGKSKTLAIHGGRTTWEGNIGYNDNHVNFETTIAPPGLVYRTAGGARPDIIFIDEADDTTGLNLILGIWTTAGTKPSEFKGIHD